MLKLNSIQAKFLKMKISREQWTRFEMPATNDSATICDTIVALFTQLVA